MSQPGAETRTTLVDSRYSKRAKDLIALNTEIESLSHSSFELNIPKIAVIGDQSSGKSSLVEAISKITVPRDGGTCTRCPMECTMTTEASWSCNLYLRKEFDSSGKELPSDRVEKVRFGHTITDPKELDLWIRRAQAAILSPHRDHSEFYDMNSETIKTLLKDDPKTLSFSRNIVGVEVKSPDSVPLTFVDLPGIIHHDSKEENVGLVRNLVKSSIAGRKTSNTVILLVLSMTGDMEVQYVNALAKECDPDRLRTVGVLTKPDLVGSGNTGDQERCKRLLEGKQDRLVHGYYCVRLPDDRQRKLGTEAFEREVKDYFDTVKPWSEVTARERFGVENLVNYLSKLLADLIESNLPNLQKQVRSLLEQYQAELAALPPPPEGLPVTRMRRLLDQFSRAIHAVVMGESHRQEYAQKNREIYARFKEDIWKTGIEFISYNTEPPSHYIQRTNLHNHDEVFGGNSVPQWEKRRGSFPKFQQRKDLTDVRTVINQSIGWELPGHVPFQATVKLVRMSTDKWDEPTDKCFESIFDNTRKVFDTLIRELFQNHDELQKRVMTSTRKEYEACKQRAKPLLQQALKEEQCDPLYTQNHHYYSSQKKMWKERYTAVCNWRDYEPRECISGQRPESDKYENELELMASVHAYWKVAFKRFIDDIPRVIEHRLNQALDERLLDRLSDEISLDEAETLMAENQQIRETRRRLQDLIRRLQDLEQLVGPYTGGDVDIDESDRSESGTDSDVPTSPRSVVSMAASLDLGPQGQFIEEM
ncbi:P-loop containing nucleoside triphosphate hydrolase protein [Marasmius fiardii PR-910]|nr:P-loop containing nucleoside triphosphate hydrolase protein [Marasmius fiardii PR-910]